MKSLVLDGERIAEAIQKTRDNLINGEYDNNDLILRSDALKAIRQKCISEHLPFKSNTPEGERVLEALVAVHQVQPYKEVCCGWISVKNRPSEDHVAVFAYDSVCRNIYKAWMDSGEWFSEEYLPDFVNITHWMPLPKPPEVTP